MRQSGAFWLQKAGGMVPLKLLMLKNIVSSVVSVPNEAGRLPLKPQLSKYDCVSFGMLA